MLRTYQQKQVTWIDLESPSEAEARAVGEELRLPVSIIEQLILPTPKPRVELHSECVYLILHFPAHRRAHKSRGIEVDFVIGKDFIVTSHYEPVEALTNFGKIFEMEAVLNKGQSPHAGFIFCEMILRLYKELGHQLDAIEDTLKHMEGRIFGGREKEMVGQLSQTGRELLSFKQTLSPHDDILESFAAASRSFFGMDFEYYLTVILGQYRRVAASVENLRDALGELRETNNALLETKQNEIMHELTVIASIFLPLTLIAQIFSINAGGIPIVHENDGFWILLGIFIMVGVLTYAFFKYRRLL